MVGEKSVCSSLLDIEDEGTTSLLNKSNNLPVVMPER
jgi:hypothetical protein